MAIEVRIPTILRTYTGGEKAVTADGASLSALIDDLEANHPGIKERLVEDKDGQDDLRRFVNVYVNDEDVRFTGGLGTELSDGDQIRGPRLEPTFIGATATVLDGGVWGRLGQHGAADVGGDHVAEISGEGDAGLPASRGAVPRQIMSGGRPRHEGEQLIRVGRPPQRVGIGNHREVIGCFHGEAEAPGSALRARSSFMTSGTGKASTVPRLEDTVVAMNREL